jgi:hypothetical protein
MPILHEIQNFWQVSQFALFSEDKSMAKYLTIEDDAEGSKIISLNRNLNELHSAKIVQIVNWRI